MQRQQGYDHTRIEPRWQDAWEEADVYRTPDDVEDPTYVLGMFPYTSGELHMGHVRNYTITDAYARYKRMTGEPVLHPMGWDSFGLPAENAAIERDTNPRDWTLECIDRMREQMDAMGFGYDWDREVTTCDPEYYRWNQWLFRAFHEAGLVERKAAEINWCPSCETVLADEQVEGEGEDGHCWRCDTAVTERELDQWFFRTTEYADELLDAIDDLEGWPDSVRGMQRNWIGRQEGATVAFEVEGHGPVEAFTTRLDTIYGATFFALAPDHPISEELAEDDPRVRRFVEEEADPDGDEPNGVATDLTATNPVTGEEIPVYVADFVLSEVGTGALMAVPAHDERDHRFAEKMDLPVRPVVAPAEGGAVDADGEAELEADGGVGAEAGSAAGAEADAGVGTDTDADADRPPAPDVSEAAFTEDGVLVNSGEYSGLTSAEARRRLVEDLDVAREDAQYRLRDWLISRQRYWGTPIPVVHCPDCGPVLVPEEDLPVELPAFVDTTGNPLDEAEDWKHTECPDCGRDAHRETDTMDTFVDSSWYFLRYVSPDDVDAPYDVDRANDWMPVDRYVGGIEHAVMHLLYSRFVTKALADMGMLDHREPFENLLAQGMVQLDGEAMSKSKGNVVSPQNIVEEYGADTARLFMMQAAQPEQDFDWTDQGVRSANAFVERLHRLVVEFDADGDDHGHDAGSGPGADDADDEVAAHVRREIDAAVETARRSYERMTFDAALRETRELVRTLRAYREHADAVHGPTFERGLSVAVRLLAPVAPHVCEEAWRELGHDEGEFVVDAPFPETETGVEDHDARRELVEDTREDIRDIVEVADIDRPERIDVAVAPDWMYGARRRAVESDAEDLVGDLMSDPAMRDRGAEAAEYARELAERRAALRAGLDGDAEFETLRGAAWLFEREFDADVRVFRAGDDGDAAGDGEAAGRAEPGRPGIHVVE